MMAAPVIFLLSLFFVGIEAWECEAIGSLSLDLFEDVARISSISEFPLAELKASQEPKEKPSASRAKLVCTMVG